MITVENTTKRYGAVTAVDDVSFRCDPGTVTGFLGPNGAGKSTTLRIITGLTPASAGSTRVNGVPYRALANPARQVGVLLDASAQHRGRTGQEILTVAALTAGLPTRRVPELLELVGLGGRAARRRFGAYSLGMRQRLGLAHALLGDPGVLVLDEPANGLDPEGIAWMRGLLRDFADRGGTVLLSSHLLREVEAVADHLVMISSGRIAADGATSHLLGGSGVLVRAGDGTGLLEVLHRDGIAATARDDGSYLVDADPLRVGRIAATSGIALSELRGRRSHPRGPVPHPHHPGHPMSTATLSPIAPDEAPQRPSLLRLTGVELRKMADTRAGAWLLVVTAVLAAGIVVIGVVAGSGRDRNLDTFLEATLFPLGVLVPVLGILAVTAEWSQRTALNTFTLVPRRERVAAAKLLCVTWYGLLCLLVGVALAAAGNLAVVLLDRGNGSWTLEASRIGTAILFLVLSMVMGSAFGMLLMNTPLAIVLYFMLPTLWSLLLVLPALRRPAEWLDLNRGLELLAADAITTAGWARLGTGAALWVLLPTVLGVARLLRREVA
jgi:ABC-2 type transport system ATP-binding protein